MNNPYRARPGKPRVDHASALNYGVPNNNNTWPSMPTSQVGPPPMNTNVYQSQVTNEPQVSNIHSFDDGSGEDDSWNWDSGNADTKKDAWNWSIDQSAELQAQRQHQQFQQHHQQQQQQQHQPQQQQPQQFQHQQQPVPIQSRVPLSYQNQGNFNMNYNSNNFPIEIPVQQSTDKHVFNNAHSDPLSQYPKYSTNEQTENLSHSNFTKDNLSSVEQAQWQSMDQQFNRNSPPKLSMPVQSFNQQSHGHQQQELPDTNNYNWNRKPENLMHENQNQSRKTSLDRQANQWPNEQHATQLYENVHSSSLQRPQNSKSPLESVNLSQSWQSNTTQHSEVKNELNESIVNDGFINTNQSWQRSDLAQSFTPSTGYMPGNVLNTSEPTGSQDDQTSQLANDIQMLNIKQADFELENVSLQDSNNDNRSRLLTSDSIVEKNLNTEGNFNQSKTVEVPPPNVNQSNFNQQFQNFNTYPTESKAFVTSQWPSAPKSPEIVTPATQETVYHQPEPSALAQSNATFNNSNVPQVPITSVSLQPLNYSLGYENRIDHQQLESSNFGENFVGIQQPHEPEQVSQYQNQQVDESKNSSIIQQQNTEIEQPGSVLNSSQSDLQYRQNDTIQSPGLDQWYNQIGPQSAPSIHYDDKNRSQLQAQSQVELQRPPQNPTTDTYNYVQPSMGHQNQNIDTQKSHDISSKLSTSETLQIDSDSSTMKIHNLQNPIQAEPSKQSTDSYEFASNDRNTFLETGELTDSHHESNSKTPSQDDDNDEITNDIPFLREVPGQSSSVNQQRNSPAGRNQYSQSIPRLSDVRRTEPFGHNTSTERVDFRDIPSGQEKHKNGGGITRESDVIERRNDPSGRERSLPPPVQLRNEPSGEQRIEQQQQQQQQSLTISQGQKNREDTESDNENESGHSTSEMSHQSRQIPGETYMDEAATSFTETSRIVTGSQGTTSHVKQSTESSKKREEAVGASINEEKVISSSPKRRNSYIDRDDESDNSPDDEIIERKKESSPINSSRYDYEKKIERNFYDRERDRELDDDYYYDRVRNDYDRRSYNSRDELDRNDTSFRDGDRRIRDGNERVLRDDDRRGRYKDEAERSMRRRDERQRERRNESRRPKESTTARDYDPGYPRNRDYPDRERRRDERRRGYDDYDSREQRREYCDDGYSRSSRPSSRSSYNDRELDYYMRSRENYYGYNNYSRYEYNQNYYSYWENLRRTNPVAYAEWYHKYYANQQQHQQQQQQQQQQLISHDVSNYREDRGSVHSGRSSCDERNTTGKQTFSELSMIDDLKSTSRMTPTKFSTSHGQGSFSIGSFLHLHASYPADGERARVDLLQINSLLSHDLIVRNLRVYPGPLIKGVTHKKTIIEYCENQIKKASLNDDLNDPASYILLYQLMVMLIQQNGNVVGVDIATLLLKNKESYPYDVNEQSRGIIRRDSVISQRSSGTGGDGSVYNLGHEIEAIVAKPRKTIEQLTEEFRNTLLYGLVQDALEFAMTEGLWGHALFLASKLDKRTHASVMTRFANSLPIQDPLQTLYQLHSGRVPASVTCVADSKWDDWRPHLAMIISNASANPDINCRSIIILGDTLAARGNIYAAHFCYILAQIDFGMNENSNDKLVLIGANHHKNYTDFANPEAIMLTEIYEYARNLSEPGFTIVGLQSFKFEIVQKLIDYGFLEKALLYLEQISINIVNAPSKFKRSFINEVYSVSERIKFHDPIFKDSTSGDDTALVWLNNLARIVDEPQTNEIYHENNVQVQENLGIHNVDQTQQQQQQNQWNYDNRQLEYNSTNLPRIDVPVVDVPEEQWQPSSQINPQDSFNIDQNVNHNSEIYNQYEQQQHQQQQQMDNQIQSSYDQVKHPTNNYDWQQQTNQWSYQPLQTDANSIQEESSGSNYEENKAASTNVSTQIPASKHNSTNESSLDASMTPLPSNTIRRRKINSKIETVNRELNDTSYENNIEKQKKIVRYPKLTTNYPNINDIKKLSPNKVKKIDGRYIKPPSIYPPEFKMCKPKLNMSSEKSTEMEKSRKILLNKNIINPSDLDIQFSQLSIDYFKNSASRLSDTIDCAPEKLNNSSKTFQEYCNFEEKKFVRVAPHIRRKDVICDTVDAWAADDQQDSKVRAHKYKPIIFDGTFNIDAPMENTDKYSTNNKYTVKHISKTFDIDAPIN